MAEGIKHALPNGGNNIWEGKQTQYLRKVLRLDSILHMDSQRKVISIVGPSGIGKTALVSRVYNEDKRKFKHCAFVSLSKLSNNKRSILADILCQISPHSKVNDCITNRQLIDAINVSLRNSRYFIVIDDMCYPIHWKIIKRLLPNNGRASIVIAITRLNSIAKECASGELDFIYRVKPLSKGESSSLLDRIIGSAGSYPDEILEVCGGMPLALKCIGSMLAENFVTNDQLKNSSLCSGSEELPGTSSGHWMNLREKLFECCSGPPNGLETCSLYLSTLPRKHVIERDSIIRKWIAEGLIVPEEQHHSLGAVARIYFDKLVNRNVIHPREYGYSFSEEASYDLHPFMLYVLMQISQERHLSFGQQSTDVFHALQTMPAREVKAPLDDQLISMLDMDGCGALENHHMASICRNMVQLKYLSLKKTQVNELPPDIRNLCMLKTLDVRETGLKELPSEVVELDQLENLLLGRKDDSHGGVKLPSVSGVMYPKSLQVLSGIDSRGCPTDELSNLTELRELGVLFDDCKFNLFRKLPAPHGLQMLKVAGRCVNVPVWMKHFKGLTFLDIRVYKLNTSCCRLLGMVGSLQTLVLTVVGLQATGIVIKKDDGFGNLENFTLDCREPWIAFHDGAMPRVKRLQMKLYGGRSGRILSGINQLTSLENVVVRFSPRYEGSACVEETVDAIRKFARTNENRVVTLSLNGKEEIPKMEVSAFVLLAAFVLRCAIMLVSCLLSIASILVFPFWFLRCTHQNAFKPLAFFSCFLIPFYYCCFLLLCLLLLELLYLADQGLHVPVSRVLEF